MKRKLTFIISFVTAISFSQVKIGDNPTNLNSTSLLELESTEKVLVVTRLTDAQMTAITPLTGAIIYNTTQNCLFQYNNLEWKSLCKNSSLVNNNNGTYTYTDANGSVIINTTDADSNSTNELISSVSLNGNNLEIVDAGGTKTVDLSLFNNPGTDNQNIAGTAFNPSSSILTVGIEGGNSQTINLSDLEESTEIAGLQSTINQNQATLTALISANTTSINNHINSDVDTSITNELQDITLTGTKLKLTNPSTAGNEVDLTSKITRPMLANANNVNESIFWDGAQWVLSVGVKTVNNTVPNAFGNINIPVGNVYTGPTTSTSSIAANELGGTPNEGDIYVVNSSATDPTQVGRTYIYDADTSSWIDIDPFNQALYDPVYVNVSGDTMTGNLSMNGNTVTNLSTPVNNTDAATKAYVDIVKLIDNNNGSISLQKPDGTIDTINKANIIANTNGTYTFTNNDGSDLIIDKNANAIPYVNTTSGLTATNVQAALDELSFKFSTVNNELIFDGKDDVATANDIYYYVSILKDGVWKVIRYNKSNPNQEWVANIANNPTQTTQPLTLATCSGLIF